jgi:hypothetical protein
MAATSLECARVVSPDFSAEFFAAGFCYKDPASSPSDKWQLIDTALYDNMIQIGRAGKTALQQVDAVLPK